MTEEQKNQQDVTNKINNVARIFFGAGSGLLAFAILIAIGAFFFLNQAKESREMRKELALLNQHFVVQNQQLVLSKLIAEKLPKLSSTTQVEIARVIYEQAQIKKIPISLICGLIDVESTWNPDAVSEAGAIGLMQTMPGYARPYLRERSVEYSRERLFDPVTNVIVGIAMFADMHAGHVESGHTKVDDFVWAAHSYFWGQSNTLQLLGKKDRRVDTPNFSYPLRVLERAKKYKELGLE